MVRKSICASAAAALALAAAPAAAQPSCTTVPSPDGAEPPCNPYAANSPYSMAHRTAYAQASTPLPGPRPGKATRVTHRPLAGIPLAAIFSPTYPDGRRVAWMPAITRQQDSLLYKVDVQSARVLDVYHRTIDEAEVPRSEPAISRVYGALDRDNRLIRAAGAALEILGDAEPGRRESPIALLKRWRLPDRAKCRDDDVVVGATLLYDGRVVFVTHQGMVGAVPRAPEAMRDEHLIVTSINGAACDDPDAELETTTNSLVADEHGGAYPLTTKAQYRFDVGDRHIRLRWRMPYRTGAAGGGGVRQDAGSGSTPTLMGTRPSDDRFVVVVDGQKLMHLVLMWRDEIPHDWTGLPGRPRRIACEHPVTFGDPERDASQSEQSVVVRGYASFIPNNELRNAGALAALPESQTRMAVAGLAGQSPANAPRGFERIDWDPAARTCSTTWVNEEVSIPNGVPFASVGSGLVYGIGQRNGVNGLEGMDIATGESKLWVPSGPQPTANAFFSALSIGEHGDAWTGGAFGFTRFARGALPEG